MIFYHCLLLLLAGSAVGLRRTDLFPFGAAYGDRRLDSETEDVSSREIALAYNVKFFGHEYGSIFVNENGLLSFLTEIPSFFNVQFPLDYPLMAALYADADCRGSGDVWYRNASDSRVVRKVREMVSAGFPDKRGFIPREVFIATWDNVGYYEERSDRVSLFYSGHTASRVNDSGHRRLSSRLSALRGRIGANERIF